MAFVRLISRLDDLSEYVRTISVASDIGIKILGAASQSAEHFRIADVTNATIHLNVDSNGDVGIGATPSSSNLEVTRTRTDTSGTRRGIFCNLTLTPASDSSCSFRGLGCNITLTGSANLTGNCYGVLGSATNNGSGTITNLYGGSFTAIVSNGGAATTAYGVFGVVQMSAVASTISGAIGGQFQITNLISGGVITAGLGVSVAAPSISAGAAITTLEGVRVNNQGATGVTTSYGIRVRNQTGATTSHAIFSEGGQSTLQTGADAIKALLLKANSGTQTATLFEAQDSGAVSRVTIGSLSTVADHTLALRAITSQTGKLISFQNAAGTEIGSVTTVATFNTGSIRAVNSSGIGSGVTSSATGDVVLFLKGANGQTANLLTGIDTNSNVNAFITATGAGGFKPRDAATATIVTGLTIGHNSSGTPTTAYGAQVQYVLKSSTTEDQAVAEESVEWATATDASRKGRFKINVYDTAVRECFRAEASGTAAMVGFLGAAAVVRQTLSAAGSDAATTQTLANSIRTALLNYGLGV